MKTPIVCPYHEIKCEEIRKNTRNIEKLRDENIKEIGKLRDDMNEELKNKVPRWVFITFVTSAITVFTIFSGLVLYGVRASNKEIKSASNAMSTVQANQKILLEAFDIKPIEKNKGGTKDENP